MALTPSRTPRRPPAPATTQSVVPTRESFHLGVAERAYVTGSISVEEYEQAVEHVLDGGLLTQDARPATAHDAPARVRPGKPESR